MKKIMFNNHFGLEDAVLNGTKTMTRRFMPIDLYDLTDWKEVKQGNYVAVEDSNGDSHDIRQFGMYKVGEVVAIAQNYDAIMNNMLHGTEESFVAKVLKAHNKKKIGDVKGWFNKMYVRADLMPHQIQITDVKVERLQDITDEDSMKEGIIYDEPFPELEDPNVYVFDVKGKKRSSTWRSPSPKIAFENLIRLMSGKKTWEDNPYVFVYSFKLIK